MRLNHRQLGLSLWGVCIVLMFDLAAAARSESLSCNRACGRGSPSWRRLLGVPWTARRSNQSILKEINPEYSLEGLLLAPGHVVCPVASLLVGRACQLVCVAQGMGPSASGAVHSCLCSQDRRAGVQ